MSDDKLYTIELKKVLTIMAKDLINDYPFKKITTEHFVLSLLLSKNSIANKILHRVCESKKIDDIYDYYSELLNNKKNSVNNLKELDNVGYDTVLSNHLIDANSEKEKLNDPKISSEHVFLSILKINDDIKRDFQNIGVTYESFSNEINHMRIDEIKKDNNRREVLKSITGNNTSKIKKNGFIDVYCQNLNVLHKNGAMDKVIGRENEIERVVEVLGRRLRNNVIIVGDSGVGKTAMVNGIVEKIENNEEFALAGKTIFSLNTVSLFIGAIHRGMLEERIDGVINELKNDKDCILFIDDIHNMVSSGGPDIISVLLGALSDGEVKVIATTNYNGYKSYIENESSISRRFQKVTVEETDILETENILKEISFYYEKYHNVKYTEDAIKACVYLAKKYVTGRKLPDSAIDIMDECGSKYKKKHANNNSDLIILKKDLVKFESMRDKCMKVNDFSLGDEYNKKVKEIKSQIIDIEKTKKNEADNTSVVEICEDKIYGVVSSMTGVPISRLTVSEKEKYLNIEKSLNKSIIGQNEAISEISKAVRRNRIGIRKKDKPSSMLFIGESGVGKTFLAQKLAEEIYGSENSLVRFDMSEYSDKTSVNKIIGSSAGYIGYEKGGVLTEAIKKNPYCVLLLDEIEKADKDVYNVFLQVFDNGFITDNTGVKVSFRNVIIIMTSNIGVKDAITLGRGTGFQTDTDKNKQNIIEKSVRKHFPIEFINRIDNIVYFNSLSDDDLKKIIEIELDNLKDRVNKINLDLNIDENVLEFIYGLIKKDENTGARKINRAIQNNIEDKISDLYIEGNYDNGHVFNIKIENNELIVK